MAKKAQFYSGNAKLTVSKPSSKSRGKRKLADEAVLAIVEARRLGDKVVDLASKHAVSPAAIYSLLKGKTYSWLTGISAPALAAA